MIGYARASIDDQFLDLQRSLLKASGCERVVEGTARSAKAERAGLTGLLSTLREGDTLVVWRLDRLGRSLKELIGIAEQMDSLGVGLRSLQDNIDTGAKDGRQVFHLFALLADFDRNLARERAREGVLSAESGESKYGRKKLLDSAQREKALSLYYERQQTVMEICRLMGISRATFYRYLAEAEYNAQRSN